MNRRRIPIPLLLLFTLFSVALLLQPVRSADAAYQRETTREEILASRQKRSRQLETMLEDSQQRLSDHLAGTKVLSENDRAALEKKIHIYQRKLETMKGDLDDRDVERILRRDQLRDERVKARRIREEGMRAEL